MLETDSVTVCFFGDGASNQGTFHESLNLASIWKLPVIFVCENNQYGMCTMASSAVSVRDISERARGYGMPGITVDGNDVMAVYEAAHRAVEMARSGEGPTLIECKTYRFHPHAEGEEAFGWRYRSADEVEEWRKRCPIARLEKEFLSRGILSNQEMERIKEEVKKEIEEAAEYARKSSEAEPEDALLGLFVQSGGRG
jgi:pyruvate dehydrogenase E1 component alpha subunit